MTAKKALYQSKQDFLDDWEKLNPGVDLPYDSIQLNYDHIKSNNRFNNDGTLVDWDNMIYTPGVAEMYSNSLAMAYNETLLGAEALMHDTISEIAEILPGNWDYLELGADEYAREVAEQAKTYKETLADNPDYAGTIAWLKENPYSTNKTSWLHQANILGQGTMSIGTTMMATLGAGMLTAGSGGGLAPVLASGFAMFAMEGGGEYIESYMYHSQDKLVDKVQHDKDLQDFKNNYINVNGKKYSELPYMQQKLAEQKFIADNYSITTDTQGNKEFTKLGLSTDEVRDIGVITGLAYGTVSGFEEMTLGIVSNKMMGIVPKNASLFGGKTFANTILPYFSDKFARNLRRIPKKLHPVLGKTSTYMSRLISDKVDDVGRYNAGSLFKYNPLRPTNMAKVLASGTMEGVTEMTQLVSQKFIANNLGGRDEEILNFDDLMQAFHGGALISGGVMTTGGTRNFVMDLARKNEKLKKAIDTPLNALKNKKRLYGSLQKLEEVFFYEKQDDGSYAMGYRWRDTDGKYKKELFSEDDLQEGFGLSNRVNSKYEAGEMVNKIQKSVTDTAQEVLLENNLYLKDSFITKSRTKDGKFKVSVTDRNGKEIVSNIFDERAVANKVAKNLKDDKKAVNKVVNNSPDIHKKVVKNSTLPENEIGRVTKSNARLILDDALNRDLTTAENAALDNLIPLGDDKRVLQLKIEALNSLNKDKDADYIAEIEQYLDEQGMTFKDFTQELKDEASQFGIEVNEDLFFTGEFEDTTIEEEFSFDDDTISDKELEFEDKALEFEDIELDKDLVPPPGKATLDSTKIVDAREFQSDMISKYSTENLIEVKDNLSNIYNEVDAGIRATRIDTELQRRKEVQEGQEAEEGLEGILENVSTILSKDSADMTEDDLYKLRDFEEIYRGDTRVNVKKVLEGVTKEQIEAQIESKEKEKKKPKKKAPKKEVSKEAPKKKAEPKKVPEISKKEIAEREEKEKRKAIEADEAHDATISKMESIVRKKPEDLTNDELSSLRDFKEIFTGSQNRKDINILKQIEKIESVRDLKEAPTDYGPIEKTYDDIRIKLLSLPEDSPVRIEALNIINKVSEEINATDIYEKRVQIFRDGVAEFRQIPFYRDYVEEAPIEEVAPEEHPIFKARADDLVLSDEQKTALIAVNDLINTNVDLGVAPDNYLQNIVIITGYAGTGKTTIIENMANHIAANTSGNVYLTAFTNRAVGNIKNKVQVQSKYKNVSIQTLHSTLYGEPDEFGVFKHKTDLTAGDYLIVDEASMISQGVDQSMMEAIIDRVLMKGAKVIFIGDDFQLPPVNGESIIIGKGDVQLKKVHRQSLESPILSLATIVRNTMSIILPSNKDPNNKVIVSNNAISMYLKDIKDVNANNNVIWITDTNKPRIEVNKLSRKTRYGDWAKPIQKNDRIIYIGNSKYHRNGETDIVNSKEQPLKLIKRITVPYKAYPAATRTEQVEVEIYENTNNGEKTLLVPYWKTAGLSHSQISSLYFNEIKEDGPKSNRAIPLPKNVNIATYGYAITAHKSQGSEWSKVYIHQNMFDREDWDSERWFYTAITRSSDTLIINDVAGHYTNRMPWEEINEKADESTDEGIKKLSLKDKKAGLITKSIDEYINFLNLKFVDRTGKPKYEVVRAYDSVSSIGGQYDHKTKTITFNVNQITPDTPFHEFAHPFISELNVKNPKLFNSIYEDLLSTKLGKRIDRETRKNPAYKDLEEFQIREEVVVTALGEMSQELYEREKDRISLDSKEKSRFRKIIERVYNAIKEFIFGPNYTKIEDLSPTTKLKDVAELLASGDKILLDGMAVEDIVARYNNEMVMHSITSPRSVARRAIVRTLSKAYNDISGYWKRKLGRSKILDPYEFRDYILNNGFIKDPYVMEIFEDWFSDRFGELDFMMNDDIYNSIRESNEGRKFIKDFTDWGQTKDGKPDGPEHFAGELREGLGEIFNEDTDYGGIATSRDEWQFLYKLGIEASKPEIDKLTAIAYNKPDFASFLSEFESMFGVQDLDGRYRALAFYLLKQNSVSINNTNIDKDGKLTILNERDNFIRILEKNPETDEWTDTIVPKTENNLVTGEKNIGVDRNNLIEVYDMKGLLGKLSFEDSLMKEIFYNQETGMPEGINHTKEFAFSMPSMKSLYESKIAVIGTRGDGTSLITTRITPDHINEARKILNGDMSYWKNQKAQGFMGKKKDADSNIQNYTSQLSLMHLSHEIAVHEAMVKIFPAYLKYDLKTIIKRIKIPTTPVTTSDLMPDYKVAKYDPENVTFVTGKGENATIISAKQLIDNVDYKYIGDGGSLTSSKMIKDKYRKAFGTNPSMTTAKTIIYSLDRDGQPNINDGMIAIKHNQFLPEKGLKIYDNYGEANERLIAEVDDNGNIQFYDKKGNQTEVDMLMTEDEAKIVEGKYKNDFNDKGYVELPGKSLGFIKSHDKVPKFAHHLMQWYNHITDQGLLDMFNQQFVDGVLYPNLRTKLVKNFVGKPDKVVQNLINIYKQYEKEQGIDFYGTAIEHAKNGAGLHPAQLPSLKEIIMRIALAPNIRLERMDGTRSDIVPNLRGDLDTKEVAISMQNAKRIEDMIIKDIGPQTWRTFSKNKLKKLNYMNQWLKDNEVNILVGRTPVPHDGGVQLVRVKRLHLLENQIIMHHDMIFKMLEADSDGDYVQIEFLDDKVVEDYKEWFDNQPEVKGISLTELEAKVDKQKSSMKFTNLYDRRRSIDEIVTGQRAIPELANIQTFYGVMQNTIGSISLRGKKVVMKGPNEIIEIGLIKEPLARGLRILLQAAADNGKYMMIKSIGYENAEINNAVYDRRIVLKTKFFRYEDGTELDFADAYALVKLLEGASPNLADITRMGNFDGRFDLDTMYELSEKYHDFTMNKDKIMKQLIDGQPHGTSGSEFNHIRFKKNLETDEYILHPKESIAILLNRAKEGHEVARDTKSQNNGPWDYNIHLHRNTHIDAINEVQDENLNDLFQDALKRDGKIDLAQKSKEKYMSDERQKGINHAQELRNKYNKIIHPEPDVEFLTSQPDASERYVNLYEEFHNKFKNLSEVAKVYATMAYLGDGALGTGDGKAAHALTFIPPASKRRSQYSNLDWRTLNKYFVSYNNILLSGDASFSPSLAKKIDVKNYKEMIEEVCSV